MEVDALKNADGNLIADEESKRTKRKPGASQLSDETNNPCIKVNVTLGCSLYKAPYYHIDAWRHAYVRTRKCIYSPSYQKLT
jgi:hypothetical protein